ncbi:DUF3040 domain-containing protein [Kitasatospora sp. NPDC094015]|uniref:DUF3040 domain-containing protein n=1 Tax=Kitasatospora sp. NPDC094015 TaxID=3155205 RepID=UPI00332F0D20
MSWHERQILASIEAELRADTRLDRQLSTMRPGRLQRARMEVRAVRGSTVVWLVVCAVGLLAVGVREPSVAVLVMLGVIWTAVVVAVAGLVGGRRGSPH